MSENLIKHSEVFECKCQRQKGLTVYKTTNESNQGTAYCEMCNTSWIIRLTQPTSQLNQAPETIPDYKAKGYHSRSEMKRMEMHKEAETKVSQSDIPYSKSEYTQNAYKHTQNEYEPTSDLAKELQRTIEELAQAKQEIDRRCRENIALQDQYQERIKELEDENKTLTAKLRVANDSRLRIYDGLTTRHDRYRIALKVIEMAPRILHKDNLVESMQRLAKEALGKDGGG